jgi:predicted RNA binding protein YcfA (HicA-like mRNA interferase family)
MGNHRPLKTKCVESFLLAHGYSHKRTSASHDQWTKPQSRTIPLWGDEKEIPANHLRQIMRTIGNPVEYLYQWAEKNC